MRSPEQEGVGVTVRKLREYGKQLAREVAGIEAFRWYKKRSEESPDRRDPAMRAIPYIFAADSILLPLETRLVEIGDPYFSSTDFWPNLAFLMDMGVNVAAILLAVSGHPDVAGATKVYYNVFVNNTVDIAKTRRENTP